jgi:hypothetical protein
LADSPTAKRDVIPYNGSWITVLSAMIVLVVVSMDNMPVIMLAGDTAKLLNENVSIVSADACETAKKAKDRMVAKFFFICHLVGLV